MWILPTFQAANQPLVLAFMALILLASFLAFYVVGFGVLRVCVSESWLRPFVLAAGWVGFEFLRTHLFSGFPWALLAHSQAAALPLIQVSSLTGAWGVSFVLVLVQAWVIRIGVVRRSSHCCDLFVPILLVVVVFFGIARLKNKPNDAGRSFSVALLQGNIDQYQKWDQQYEEAIYDRYAGLVREPAAKTADVIIWPESAIPAWIPNDRGALSWLSELVRQSSATHIVGAVSRNIEPQAEFNSAFLFNPQGVIEAQYNKQHLVPFGEVAPLRFLLGWIPYLGQLGTFNAGNKATVFNIHGKQWAPLICYEIIFPQLVRRSVRQGADVVVNLTNDGWYLSTGAPEQHFVTSIFRAIEVSRPVVRVANTGISAVIDPTGQIQLKTPLMKTEVFVQPVNVADSAQTTFYLKWGDWFAWFCLMVTVVPIFIRLRNRFQA